MKDASPAFLDDDGPSSDLPIPPHRNRSLPEVLASLSDDELAAWPGALADQERTRRKSYK
ncbi:hypothetical protein FIV60_23145 [Salmonella enterica]|jgi:hypothetical protein|uniref:hypothetical protein n=1 Tax=Gammaproteobacteria TaxID=1236 RepID=UPI0012C86BFC|nr:MULTISPECIES: hypothetical protein [Gammaproteobacteria]EBG3541952.1 hypothetical protein [Salmonella enterica]EBP7822463.1 hypothetical protein [Salmonella enterica]ECA4695087.1 hypothetical protein [Salmonella enterica subsp. enterica serovar Senftenberg]MDX7717430.1 hypothetical protein [Aeromonas caviae]